MLLMMFTSPATDCAASEPVNVAELNAKMGTRKKKEE